jgi:hypothetical protein
MEGTAVIKTLNGFCHGCREGRVGQQTYGFALCTLEGHPPQWFCLCCGTNDVTVIDDDLGLEYSVHRAHVFSA